MKSAIIGLGVVVAFAAAAVVSTPAYSKDKKSKAQEAKEEAKKRRDALVKEYETKRGGKLFLNQPYWVDKANIKDTRWEVSTRRAGSDKQRLELVASMPAAKADQPPRIHLAIWTYKHKTQKGSSVTTHSYTFDKANMANVVPSKLEDMLKAKYLSFKNTAKDPIEKQCKEPKKVRSHGPAKMRAIAVGTDLKANARVRKEWYGWVDQHWTYIVTVTFSNQVYDKKDWHEKAKLFLQRVRETN